MNPSRKVFLAGLLSVLMVPVTMEVPTPPIMTTRSRKKPGPVPQEQGLDR